MAKINITRPQFPKGYVDNPSSLVSWDYVVRRLTESKNYWLCSVRPDSRPHAVPRWGVFLEGKLYYDGSPETRHARNIQENPQVSLHLESGDKALIAEGISVSFGKPGSELSGKLSAAFCSKYEKFGYAPEPNQWDEGGLFVFTPKIVLAWTNFLEDPTKFVLEEE